MAYGVKKLGKLQIGAETTYGTAVTPDVVWRGEAMEPQDDSPWEFIAEDVGDLLGYNKGFFGFYEGTVEMADTAASFEQLPHILAAGLKTVAGVRDGSAPASGYLYTYPFPTSAQQTIKSYTIRGGDNNRVSQMKGAFVDSFTISGEAKGLVNVAATWKGHRPTSSSFAAISLSSTHDLILFQNSKLYIAAVGSYNGAVYPAISTQITNTFVGFTLDASGLNMQVHTGDGSLNPSFVKAVGGEITLAITMENDGNASTEWANFQAGTPRVVSILTTGATLSNAGTLFSKKSLIIDCVGVWSEFPSPSESDGNNQIEATLTVRNDLTAGTSGRITVVNELSALP